jgi:hypothetical protein
MQGRSAFGGFDRGLCPYALGAKNAFVIGRGGRSRTIAHKRVEYWGLLSTLIEACASKRRGFAISNEEQSDV